MGADKIPGRISRQALPRIKASPLVPLHFPSETGLVLQTRKVTAPECVCYVLPHTCQTDQGLGRQWTRQKIEWREGRGRDRHAEREEKRESLYRTTGMETCGVSPNESGRTDFPSEVQEQPEEAGAVGGWGVDAGC